MSPYELKYHNAYNAGYDNGLSKDVEKENPYDKSNLESGLLHYQYIRGANDRLNDYQKLQESLAFEREMYN